MKDVIELIHSCIESETPFALATVLKTWGSSPRKMGAHMVVAQSGQMAGSVSGGCVEGDMARRSAEVIKSQKPELIQYGVSNEDAWQVGLSCGGKIEVFLEPFLVPSTLERDKELLGKLYRTINQKDAAIIAHRISEDIIERSFISTLEEAENFNLGETYTQVMKEKRHIRIEHDSEDCFIEVIMPVSRLILIGASHIASDLVHFANQLGFETVVIDPRRFFTDHTQFSSPPDQLIQNWPAEVLPDLRIDSFTYAVTLTHDPKIDDQALEYFLTSEVAYIGALGSRRTHEKRLNRLKEKGISEELMSKIHGPVGLPIKAQTAKEIALSIIAEIVQAQNQFA